MKPCTSHAAPTSVVDRFAQFDLILDARGLSPAERFTLCVLWRYADPNGVCWPSVKRIARMTGYHKRSVEKYLAALIDRGIVQTLSPPTGRAGAGGRGITSLRRINYARLCSLVDSPADLGNPKPEHANPVSTPGFHHDASALQTPAKSAGTPGPECANPGPEPDEQTITNHEQTNETNHRAGSESVAHDDGWMPELGAPDPDASTEPVETTYHALAACGVRGDYLDRLAAEPGLTAAIVWDEYRDVKADTSVRSGQAVLVGRLSKRLGVVLKRNGGAIAPDVKDYAARIEQARRNLRAD